MPGFKEVEFYLTGLWLLLKGSATGFGYLDISDRGVRRSFWSILWSLPAMFVSWLFWYRTLTMGMMGEDQGGGVFFLRMAMIDMASWFLPLVLIAIVCLILSMAQHFNAIVVTTNWLALPIAYANAALVALAVVAPSLGQVIILLWLMLLLGLAYSVFRLMAAIVGPHTLLVATLTMVMLVPTTLLSEFLQGYLNVNPL
ncbi:hypothetical protein [Rhizobium oryziradicis]|uniref:Yip1 domain-containing protein n=1 Tax=Rhizobium oryziradicis TaxID=1867956 RepID=A0A1Q8ZSN1_9HYPH|nr:hypothetical protein [Rhizobium oryziradicis]OLP45089.1 hypothetical protein BJF95_17225 [Rhizobium oryziradicis]